MKSPDVAIAVQMYYAKIELNSADIKQLFNCGGTTATRLKKDVLKEMAKSQVKTWLPETINTKIAYKVWNIDIVDFEKRLKK